VNLLRCKLDARPNATERTRPRLAEYYEIIVLISATPALETRAPKNDDVDAAIATRLGLRGPGVPFPDRPRPDYARIVFRKKENSSAGDSFQRGR